jgi:hypothetical protein
MNNRVPGPERRIPRTSTFCGVPNSVNTAATLLPFASRMAPSRLPAYAPTTRPGTLAVINPRPAPHAAPNQVHNGRWRSTSGRRSYRVAKEKKRKEQKKGSAVGVRTVPTGGKEDDVRLQIRHQILDLHSVSGPVALLGWVRCPRRCW